LPPGGHGFYSSATTLLREGEGLQTQIHVRNFFLSFLSAPGTKSSPRLLREDWSLTLEVLLRAMWAIAIQLISIFLQASVVIAKSWPAPKCTVEQLVPPCVPGDPGAAGKIKIQRGQYCYSKCQLPIKRDPSLPSAPQKMGCRERLV